MRVLRQLRDLDFQCEHSGTYEDPVTGKSRQFDIRARKSSLGKLQLALAVECKNIRPYNPLLLSAVPRTDAESFHDCIEFVATAHGNWTRCRRFPGTESAYPVGEWVGKKTDQIGREGNSAELVSDVSSTFEKLNQAVNSCRDLVRDYGSTANSEPPWRTPDFPSSPRSTKQQSIHQLRRSLHPLLRKLGIRKQGFHGFRRFRITHLRKQRVLKDLIDFWVGHAPENITEVYVNIKGDEAFRRQSAEKAGLGFQLKSLYLFPSVPLDSGFEDQSQVLVV